MGAAWRTDAIITQGSILGNSEQGGGLRYLSWGVQGQSQLGVIAGGAECWESANEHLRRETHFDGVEALVRKLTPALKLGTVVYPQVQVVAPLPFDLVDCRNGGV